MQFTQLDMEMSFMDDEAIMALAEELIGQVFEKVPCAFLPASQ